MYRGKPGEIGNIPTNTITTDIATAFVEDFEFLLETGESLQSACIRLNVSAKTVIRRYKRLEQKPPSGLYTLASSRNYKKKAAA
ncbi:LamD-like [Gordonia phage Sixama]|uniref:LamD-like n=1 Tax=Gordonia phage Sixama TaxID=2653271 RepID=A0A5Q2F4B5_9CAUD|nr:HNH endonuclease [Gordonia phage Sixama]QGF20337.1 LamD-like [Gordonia phage Sixama]